MHETVGRQRETRSQKNIHGTSATKLKSGYGTPSDGTFARRPKKTEKIIIVNRGCRTAQLAPSAVCLYRTLMSRQIRKYTELSMRPELSQIQLPPSPGWLNDELR